MNTGKFGFAFFIIYFIVGFSQLHSLVPGIKFVKPGLLASIGILIFLIPRLRTHKWFKPLGKLMLLFILSLVPGLFFGYATGKTRSVLITLLQDYVCIFIGASVFIDNIDRIRALNTFIILTALFTSFHVLTHGGTGPGILFDENDVGLVLTMLFPFTYFTLGFYKSKVMKTLVIVSLFMVLFAIASTLSRGAMVGIVPTLFIIWLKSKHKAIALVVIAFALIATISLGPDQLLSEFKSIKNSNEGTAGARRYFWELSIEMFKKRPIFGVGARGWGNAVWSGLIDLPRTVSNSTPHSIYFQLISELGLVGIITWGALVITTFKLSISIKNISKPFLLNDPSETENYKNFQIISSFNSALMIGVIGGLICGLFLSYLFYSHLYYYIAYMQVLYLNTQKFLSQNENIS